MGQLVTEFVTGAQNNSKGAPMPGPPAAEPFVLRAVRRPVYDAFGPIGTTFRELDWIRPNDKAKRTVSPQWFSTERIEGARENRVRMAFPPGRLQASRSGRRATCGRAPAASTSRPTILRATWVGIAVGGAVILVRPCISTTRIRTQENSA
jgi:hypothetical protein